MGIIETPIGWALLGMMGIGSPALGYIALRTIFSNAGKWAAWKRIASACIIGGGWAAATAVILFPTTASSISVMHASEFFALAGMGFILLIGITSIFTRGVNTLMSHAPAMTHTSPSALARAGNLPNTKPAQAFASARGPALSDVELQDDNAFAEKLSGSETKPMRVRSSFLPSPPQEDPTFSGAWEPSMQEGLGLLKEEAAPAQKPREAPSAARVGASSLDAQLEQLKKDIKAFNASASKGMHASQ